MKSNQIKENHESLGLTRREFIENCTICAAGITALSAIPVSTLFAAPDTLKYEKTRISLILAHPDPTKPNWPNIDYDFAGHIKEVHTKLVEKCPDIEFVPVTVTSGNKEQAHKILSASNKLDGYLIYLAGCLWGDMTETIAASGKVRPKAMASRTVKLRGLWEEPAQPKETRFI